MKPVPIDDALVAFPGDVDHLIPPRENIPEEFKDGSSPWCEWQRQWFYEGLKTWPETKPGFDYAEVRRHLTALQNTFSTKHEHKEAMVAYLASLWLEPPSI